MASRGRGERCRLLRKVIEGQNLMLVESPQRTMSGRRTFYWTKDPAQASPITGSPGNYIVNQRGEMCLRDEESARGCGIEVEGSEAHMTNEQVRRYLIQIPSAVAGLHPIAAHYFEKCAPKDASLIRAWLADIAVNSSKSEFVRDAARFWLQRKIEQIARKYENFAVTSKPGKRIIHFCGTFAERLGFSKDDFRTLLDTYYEHRPEKPDIPFEPTKPNEPHKPDEDESDYVKEQYERRMHWYKRDLEEYERDYRQFLGDKRTYDQRVRDWEQELKEWEEGMGLFKHRFPHLGRTYLGSGADRIVFPIGDHLIVKVCHGKNENNASCGNDKEVAIFGLDAKIARAKRAIAPRVYEYGENYVIEERVRADEDEVIGWMTELVGGDEDEEDEEGRVTSLSNHVDALRDIGGGRFNYLLDEYDPKDLHAGNWGFNSRDDAVIIDASRFGYVETSAGARETRIRPSIKRPASCDASTQPIPAELFDFERETAFEDKFGRFWEQAQRGRVPGVVGFIAPDSPIPLFSVVAS